MPERHLVASPASMPPADALPDRALNRALLARQGLLERLDVPLVDAVEAVGALQGQAYGALPVGLFARVAGFTPEDLYGALDRGELRWGIGLRGTLHLVSAREHPAYAVVAAVPTDGYARALPTTTQGMRDLRAALRAYAATPRTNDEIQAFAEAFVAEHPDAVDPVEVEAQRALRWRPIYRWSSLVRVPASGRFGPTAPADHQAVALDDAPAPEAALARVARCHLRAFGPAAADDVATWTGRSVPSVREALAALDGLVTFTDRHGRTLHDLADAPRPEADVPSPPRLLGAFDSMLLAYANGRRDRIMPDALRDVVVQKANLQIRPTFLVDGVVAGIWSLEERRREAVATLTPAGPLARAERRALTAEAEALLAALRPGARSHAVVVV
jgi:winged helix DNA-binding protein